MGRLTEKGQWPCKRDRLQQFIKHKELNALRVYTGVCIDHHPIKLDLKNKESRKKCV